MSPKYTSLENGQVIVTDEPRPDLDALARWQRDDHPADDEPQGVVPSSPAPVAGEVQKDPVTGGEPPLLSTTAGIANPAATLSQEEAQKRAAEALANGDESPSGEGSSDGGNGEPEGDAVPDESWTHERLDELAKERGVKLPSGANKADKVAALTTPAE